MHPVTTRRAPGRFESASARAVSIDSCRAASTNAQVLTTMRSASSACPAGVRPSARREATTLSESTAFFGQPRVSTSNRGATGESYRATHLGSRPVIDGLVEPGFGGVADALRTNLERRGDVGAACCLYVDGRPVVDIRAGDADVTTGRPWTEKTLALVFSTTKGATAICANLLVERGLLDPDARVAEHWPECAARGKGDMPVRAVLSHRAGLPVVEGDFTLETALAWDPVVE